MAPSLGMLGNSDKNHVPARKLRKRDIVSYVFMPKVLPRITDLFFTGFHFFAFFMAQVYRGVRLLPADHPSLNPANIGEYGVRDIIGAAWHHLVWKRENIDQIIVFIAILLGLVLLVLQASTFILAFAVPHAEAAVQRSGFSAMFGTQSGGGAQDIAFILLDRVFGVKGIFDSCVSLPNTPCYGSAPGDLGFDKTNTIYKPPVFPWPYHDGLHALFQFYSVGLLLVGVFILLYFVVVIVAETAQTGTPFGKRFNTVWAPIRLVMAFGLLIPITSGLNSAQFITLYAAKWGSNFATNGWNVFNAAIQDSATRMAQGLEFAGKPKEPQMEDLIRFMTLAHTCKVFEETIAQDTQVTQSKSEKACTGDAAGRKIDAYLVKPGLDDTKSQRLLSSFTSYEKALEFAENNDLQISFGDRNCKLDATAIGNIDPVCGEIVLPTTSLTDVGAKKIQEGYFGLIQYLWGGYGTEGDIKSYSNTTGNDTRVQKNACIPDQYKEVLGAHGSATTFFDTTIRQNALALFQNGPKGKNQGNCNTTQYKDYQVLDLPADDWFRNAARSYTYGNEANGKETPINQVTQPDPKYVVPTDYIVRNILKRGVLAVREAAASGKYNVSGENRLRGWAAAGIWYNRIAEINGSLIGAAWNLPTANSPPKIMSEVADKKAQTNVRTSPSDAFCPTTANGTVELPGGSDAKMYAEAMCQIMDKFSRNSENQPTGSALSDFIRALFGIQGLYDLRYEDNNRTHPLAMLAGVGKGLIEASIRNLTLGAGTGVFSVVLAGAMRDTQGFPELMGALSSLFFSIATITLTAGFILYYVIPFLPFLYFFFAVGNWLKGVFEAMVGVPLWALAHIRIDGNGLPGEAAMNGYFMLFEIFLRPILIVFGFLASITIFAAMAAVFHEIFQVAVDNLTGAGEEGASGKIDEFFYTIMYAVIMYMMALSSFKLIDLIPNQIMRWMGTSVSTFSDMNSDPAGSLTQMTAIAGTQMVSGMTQGVSGFMKSSAGGAAAIGKSVQAMGQQQK